MTGVQTCALPIYTNNAIKALQYNKNKLNIKSSDLVIRLNDSELQAYSALAFRFHDVKMTLLAKNNTSLITQQRAGKIGRASCRERVCQYVYISVVTASLKKKKKTDTIKNK